MSISFFNFLESDNQRKLLIIKTGTNHQMNTKYTCFSRSSK